MKATTPHIVFIGAGNMARAIIGGLLASGTSPDTITACEPDLARVRDLESQGIQVSCDNAAATARADLLVLAVKPQIMRQVCEPLAVAVQARQPLVISVAAGLQLATLEQWLGGQLSLVRCMPNTPALVQCGASALFANPRVSEMQKFQAQALMKATGLALWVEQEAQLDAVTAVSGSGPAYYFLMMEAMIAAGQALGLSEETARALTLQTALGAAQMATQSPLAPAQLRAQVTSPGGTTEQAIQRFQQDGYEAMVERAMRACAQRAEALAAELGTH